MALIKGKKSVSLQLTCPQASPMPLSPMPWGQDKFNSRASAPAASAILASSVQSTSSYPHMIEAITIFEKTAV